MGITNALIEKIKGRQISSKDQFRIVLLILSAVSILVVLLVGRFISGGLPPGSGNLKFDRQLWLAETSSKTRQGITDRQRMLKSIAVGSKTFIVAMKEALGFRAKGRKTIYVDDTRS
jgi:hypothetical protein